MTDTVPASDPTEEVTPAVITAITRCRTVLASAYELAIQIVNGDIENPLTDVLGPEDYALFSRLASIGHAARGVALTLSIYKTAFPMQDVRAHKSEHDAGFNARSIDTAVTVSFLTEHSLPRNVESHWLSQTFSFAGPYVRGSVLKTQPKAVGPLLIEAINQIEENGTPDYAQAAATAILEQLILIRNKERVILTRPKDLSVERTVDLVSRHISRQYKQNAPRLPQLVIYAAYKCLVLSVGRYRGMVLEPIERMKSADRKSGTVGDVVVTEQGTPVEAVEVKYEQEVAYSHIAEAIDKVRAVSVRRYYILSTKGVSSSDAEAIEKRRREFLGQNGCEIIINGVIDTLGYYLRLLPSTTEFLFAYADAVESDPDTNYEHRIAWNEVCQGNSA